MSEFEVKKLLEKAIDEAIERGFTTYISGGSRGVDLWAAEIVIAKKKINPNIKLIMALPHPDFEKRWGIDDRLLYDYALKNADFVKTVSNHYYKGCCQVRNQYMVNHSGLVIAVYNGTAGGTRNTIGYVNSAGIEVRILYADK
jgi:uncharacterized phage-like protein YoqJ